MAGVDEAVYLDAVLDFASAFAPAGSGVAPAAAEAGDDAAAAAAAAAGASAADASEARVIGASFAARLATTLSRREGARRHAVGRAGLAQARELALATSMAACATELCKAIGRTSEESWARVQRELAGCADVPPARLLAMRAFALAAADAAGPAGALPRAPLGLVDDPFAVVQLGEVRTLTHALVAVAAADLEAPAASGVPTAGPLALLESLFESWQEFETLTSEALLHRVITKKEQRHFCPRPTAAPTAVA